MAASKSGVSAQILPLPKGGGAIRGMGEKFQPDLHTGTGNLHLPISTPPGREDLQPALALDYSTAAGNGPFAVGWRLSIPCVQRKIEKGIPLYDDRHDAQGNPIWHTDEDVFVISETQDLVHVGHGRYRPLVEGSFSRIRKVRAGDGQLSWEIDSKNGLRSTFGPSGESRIFVTEGGATKIFRWLLQETRDPHGNRIVYSYARDRGVDLQADLGTYREERHHDYNQVYLKSIAYCEYHEPAVNADRYLWRIDFDYGEYNADGVLSGTWQVRPDPFSTYRGGFELRTARRCRRILIKRRLPGVADQYELIRSYVLSYRQAQYSGHSLLTQVLHRGHKGAETQSFPPVSLAYSEFDPTHRHYRTFRAPCDYLPERSLADANYEIIDLDGYGLPGVMHTSPTGYRYWRNLGDMRFAAPRPLKHVPAGVTLADSGVQLADMEGNGTADMLVTLGTSSGHFTNDFSGEWRRFRDYRQAPSFDLKDPNVRLVDLDGDGVVDVLSTQPHHFLYIRNMCRDGRVGFDDPVAVPRKHDAALFPDVFFGAPEGRVRLADMTGDGSQDIVEVHSRRISYWPNLGHGRFGRRLTMAQAPSLPHRYDPGRLFLSDCDGDGAADLIYIDFNTVLLWINQGGNRWSPPIRIEGTPPVSDVDSVRAADMGGTGTQGILWSYDFAQHRGRNYKYLDFTGGIKPLLLASIDNNMGATTEITYRPSTDFLLADHRAGKPWKTKLPFTVQVVSRVVVSEPFSSTRLVTEYEYHHGYWDGTEREFRGFGRVDQRDTEFKEVLNQPASHSPPVETRTWFHQGGVIDERGDPQELDLTMEYWDGDPNMLSRPLSMVALLQNLPRKGRRLALRALRGKVLRSEIYCMDGTERQTKPYTVTEHLYGLSPLPVGSALPPGPPAWQERIFFPHTLAQRVTQWERGSDPMTQFTFVDEYDQYGQPRKQVKIACPRGWRALADTPGDPFIATCSWTAFAQREDAGVYIVDRVASTTSYSIQNDGSMPVLSLRATGEGDASLEVIGQTINYYDGPAFQGLPFGQMGVFGAPVRSETLILTREILQDAYRSGPAVAVPPEMPPYLDPAGGPNWTAEYPQAFRSSLAPLAGYRYYSGVAGDEHVAGYFTSTTHKYDFHDSPAQGRGLVKVTRDSLKKDTLLDYDGYELMVTRVTDPANLTTAATYDYRAFQPREVTGPNKNRTHYSFTPLGLVESTSSMGRVGENVGDDAAHPGVRFDYALDAFVSSAQPISVRTRQRVHHFHDSHIPLPDRDAEMEMLEYTDGFGRLLQSRTRAEAVGLGELPFDDAGLPADQTAADQDAVEQAACPPGKGRVIVSGWQTYDNKGRVVEKFGPFFDCGWDYAPPAANQRRQKTTFFYDPRGQVTRTLHPDGSEQRVVFGVPGTLALPDLGTPDAFAPTPWESYTYDQLDNAGRTHPAMSAQYMQHLNTPMSATVDALGRVVKIVSRNRNRLPGGAWSAIEELETELTHDAQGNLVKVIDPLGRTAVKYVYDLTPSSSAGSEQPAPDDGARLLRIEQLDAGVRRFVLDAVGNEIERRDGKGSLILHAHDDLGRRTASWARDRGVESVTMRERLIYGTDPGAALPQGQALSANLIGRLYRHYDEAGLHTFDRYDIHGNALEEIRQPIADPPILGVFNPPPANWQVIAFHVDWQPPPGVAFAAHAAALLDAVSYRVSAEFDAVGHMRQLKYPQDVSGQRKSLVLQYDISGKLVSLSLNGGAFVDRIAYNALGQRILIAYGNGVMTRYAYDDESSRLLRMRSERFTQPAEGTYHAVGLPLQDYAYSYDLAANVLAIDDRVPGDGVAGSAVGSDRLLRKFAYDPLYRLRTATGRECDGPAAAPPWSDSAKCLAANQTHEYAQVYDYDRVGNLGRLDHVAGAASYSREYRLMANSNRLQAMVIGNSSYGYQYDANGNLTREGGDRHFEWDHSDRLKAFRAQTGSQPPTEFAQYLYDAAGHRVKKVVRKQNGDLEISTVINGVFAHQRRVSGGVQQETNYLHVLDGTRRIALVRIGGPLFADDASPAIQFHLGDHLESSNVVVDDSGAWINREEYAPFGETTFGSFAHKRFRLTGKERAEESSLIDFGARQYAPWLGRWLTCDPISLQGDQRSVRTPPLNPYAYVDNRPMIAIDPDGRVIWFLVIAAIAITGLTATSAANAPTSKDSRLYSRVSHAEHAANIALFIVTSGAGLKLANNVLRYSGSRVLASTVGSLGAALPQAFGSVAIHDVAQGRLSPLDTYLTTAGYAAGGAFVFGVGGGLLSRFGQYLRWGRHNSLVIRALKQGDLPLKRVAVSRLGPTLREMGEITLATDREVLLYTVGRQQFLRLGRAGSVSARGATGVIAHTHPPGFTGIIMRKTVGIQKPALSRADIRTISDFVKQSGGSGTHIIIVPTELNPGNSAALNIPQIAITK